MAPSSARPRFEPSPCQITGTTISELQNEDFSDKWVPLIACPANFPLEVVCIPRSLRGFACSKNTSVVRNSYITANSPPRVQFHADTTLRDPLGHHRHGSISSNRTLTPKLPQDALHKTKTLTATTWTGWRTRAVLHALSRCGRTLDRGRIPPNNPSLDPDLDTRIASSLLSSHGFASCLSLFAGRR